MSFNRAYLGHGVGLRQKHFARWLSERPTADWVEVISENFFARGGRPLAVLEKVRASLPVVMHGVSLSIGSTDPLNAHYLAELKQLAGRLEPAWISDHLCWGSHGARYVHDLWPLPYTEEALGHVVDRVKAVQDLLRRQILLENVSSYISFKQSTMSEWEFLGEVAKRADCGILLDINNVFVSARNHGFDAHEYLEAVPIDRVGQFHLAGHSDKGTHLLDTHDAPVPDEVWELFRSALRRFGRVSTLIEWDDRIPELEELLAESSKAALLEREELGAQPARVVA
jgi:uncharacterized protein (UPF0276 family)